MRRAYLGHPTKSGDIIGYSLALQFFMRVFQEGFTAWECHGGFEGKVISGIILEVTKETVSKELFAKNCSLYDIEFNQSSHLIN